MSQSLSFASVSPPAARFFPQMGHQGGGKKADKRWDAEISKFRIFVLIRTMLNRETILSTIKSRKADFSELGITKIGLFGSYIRGEETHDSDIDILIEFDSGKESFDNFMAAYEYFEELFKDQKIEVITRNSLSPYIGPFILKEVVYA